MFELHLYGIERLSIIKKGEFVKSFSADSYKVSILSVIRIIYEIDLIFITGFYKDQKETIRMNEKYFEIKFMPPLFLSKIMLKFYIDVLNKNKLPDEAIIDTLALAEKSFMF